MTGLADITQGILSVSRAGESRAERVLVSRSVFIFRFDGFFELLNSLLVLPKIHQYASQVEVCLAIVRFILHGSLVLGLGFQQSALPLQEEPQLVVRLSVTALDIDCVLYISL